MKPPLLEKESHLLPMKYPIMGLFLPPGFVPKKLLGKGSPPFHDFIRLSKIRS